MQLKYRIIPLVVEYTHNNFYLEELCSKMVEVIEISNIARHEGLLALEEYAMNVVRENSIGMFLYDALMLIVDGTEPKLVNEILENKIIAEGFDNFICVLNYVQLIGLLEVQQGTNPRIIQELFKSLVPRRCEEIVNKRLSHTIEKFRKEEDILLKESWEKIECQYEVNPLLTLFDALTKNLTREELQSVVNNVEILQLGNVLYHGSNEVKSRFDEVIPDCTKALFGESVDIYYCSKVGPDILDILRVVERLRNDESISKCSYYDKKMADEEGTVISNISANEKEHYVNWMTSDRDLSMVYLAGMADIYWGIYFEEHCFLPTVLGRLKISPEYNDTDRMYRDMANHYVYVISPESLRTMPIVEMHNVVERGNRHVHIVYVDYEKFTKEQIEVLEYVQCLFSDKVKVHTSIDDALALFNGIADAEED